MRKKAGSIGNLTLLGPPASRRHPNPLRTIDLFSGAGGMTEGFHQAGYECLYGNDQMPEAMDTFQLNHPEAWPDCRNIEGVKPSEIRAKSATEWGDFRVW